MDPAADVIAAPDVDFPARTGLVDLSAHEGAPRGRSGGAYKNAY